MLIEKYRMIERRLPIAAKPTARNGRYYIRDNFLRAWIAALKDQVAAINFIPEQRLVDRASARLEDVEGYGLEELVGQLYEERSREGIGDFSLSERIVGFWDKAGTELDLVAVNADDRCLRLGSCKRNSNKLIRSLASFDRHIQRFVDLHQRRYDGWTVERVAIAPSLDSASRRAIEAQGYIAEDLRDLTRATLSSLDGDRLGEVARLIDIGALEIGDVIGEQLERDRGEDRLQKGVDLGD